MSKVQQGQSRDFVIDNDDVLHLGTRLCMLDDDLRKKIMEEVHSFTYNIHPDSTKM